MLAYIVSYVDRQILTQLVGPIRADLGITDTQFSLLHGLAFALFYTIMGIPIARLADRRIDRATGWPNRSDLTTHGPPDTGSADTDTNAGLSGRGDPARGSWYDVRQ